MIIRKATDKDSRAVFNLLIELRRSGYQEMGEQAKEIKAGEKAPELYTELIKRSDIHILLAEENGQVIGLSVIYEIIKVLDGQPRLLIEEFVVLPDFRGKGVGSKMLDYIENIARGGNIQIVKVTTGTKLKANDFYKKHGYVLFENAYRKKL